MGTDRNGKASVLDFSPSVQYNPSNRISRIAFTCAFVHYGRMSSVFFRLTILSLLLLLQPAGRVCADPVVPGNLLEPKNAKEAWNAIRLATDNVDLLIKEKRLTEIAVQISFTSPALRALNRFCEAPEGVTKIEDLTKKTLAWVIETARAGNDNNLVATQEAFAKVRDFLGQISKFFDEKTVKAEIYFCPMHPTIISPLVEQPCERCGMSLLKRRIPYSFVYMKPGEPSVHITATTTGPVEAGKKMEVKLRLSRGEKSPVLESDLIVMHTRPIHLLIEDPSLGDYHHEHPEPTSIPGEYEFSFIPKKSSPYRIWADIVPANTGTQELPFVDLPSTGAAGSIENKAPTFSSTAGGHIFTLTLGNGNNIQPRAGQVCTMNVAISDAALKPATNLEPVMNAFAHLVGFYEDYHTVVHVHPSGGDILSTEARGGPALAFKFYPPKAGFIRFYCQVMINGEMIFAPFNMSVLP